jgi:DNA-binding Lrp family transcriptional regulator
VPLAYVLINTVPEKVEVVLEDVKEIEGVEEAYIIYGVYDIIAEVKAKNESELWAIIIKIRKLHHILSTITLQVTG